MKEFRNSSLNTYPVLSQTTNDSVYEGAAAAFGPVGNDLVKGFP